MGKIIIKNKTDISDLKALNLIENVISQGMISKGENGEQYCFLTRFGKYDQHEEVRVWSSKTKTGTFTFEIFTDDPKEKRN